MSASARRTRVLLVALACASAWAASASAPAARAADGDVLVVGDSLAVGMRPGLEGLLPGHRVRWSVRSGITTPQGMRRLRGALRAGRPQTLVLSLGTNDGPDPVRFADRIRRILARVHPSTCIAWLAIHRARRKGAYRPLNLVLRSTARVDPRLLVIGWDRMVRRGSVVLPDGIHPDLVGFDHRSRAVARAVGRCEERGR